MYKKKYSLIFFLFVLIGFKSCSLREENINIEKNKKTTLQFHISGILESNGIEMPQNNMFSAGRTTVHKINIITAKDFDVLINATKILKQKISVQPVSPGVKFRFLIYNASDNILVRDLVVISGTSPQIEVDAGKTYKWYAISSNDTTAVPSVTEGIVNSSDIANKDILYASSNGVITPEYGNNNLNIIFKHNTVQFLIQLDTRGLFGKINDTSTLEVGINQGNTFTSIIQTGDFNLFTGTYYNLQAIPAISASNMINTTNAQGDVGATKTAKFYTVNKSLITDNSLRIRLNKLDISLDDNTTRSFAPNTIINYSNIGVTPIYGNKYTISARLIESGVKVNGLQWARSNLYYADNVTHADKYRFHPNNEYTISSILNLSINGIISLQLNGQPYKITNEYWNWMSAKPTGPVSDNIDPCSKVYPEGIWRMPTNSEFTSLNNNPTLGFDTNTPLLLGGARLSSTWELDSGQQINTVYPTNSQKLFISFFGRRSVDGNQIIDSPGSIASPLLASGEAHYWTSTKNGSSVFYHNRIYDALIGTIIGPDPPTMVPGSSSQGRNIRCVRR
ncbi:hypothetical protein OZ668_15310 [Elizabethkingia sp. HX XZB]|uniref:hypothetical protein n=1 Tax=Elizabethkingia sp. HX XZB TaxID=3003193 RepID=UPI002A24E078|nr:hypothetical protein [Elizabethkingia sp. HX XZB]MDX8569368.1 hypothetical protein [Elizabethkingia sp. HX XZB]